MRNNILVLRTSAGLTIRQLARKAACSTATVNDYQNEMRTPRLDIAYRVAKVLKVSVLDVFPAD